MYPSKTVARILRLKFEGLKQAFEDRTSKIQSYTAPELCKAEKMIKDIELRGSEIDNCEDQIKYCEDQIKKCEDQIKKCEDQIKKCEDRIKKCEDRIKKCKDQIKKGDDQIKKCKDLIKKYEYLINCCDDLIKRCEDLFKKREDLIKKREYQTKKLHRKIIKFVGKVDSRLDSMPFSLEDHMKKLKRRASPPKITETKRVSRSCGPSSMKILSQ